MSRLAGVQPALVAAEAKLAQLAAARGWAYTVNAEEGGGYVRTESDTARYQHYRAKEYAEWLPGWKAAHPGKIPPSIYEWRPISPYGSSFHNFGAAFDITPVRGTLAQIGSLAPAAGLKWGGGPEFVAVKRRDDPHFQLPITLLEAKARWLAMGKVMGARTLVPAVQGGVAVVVALLVGWLAFKGYHA